MDEHELVISTEILVINCFGFKIKLKIFNRTRRRRRKKGRRRRQVSHSLNFNSQYQ